MIQCEKCKEYFASQKVLRQHELEKHTAKLDVYSHTLED
jgi:hypothetical protein